MQQKIMWLRLCKKSECTDNARVSRRVLTFKSGDQKPVLLKNQKLVTRNGHQISALKLMLNVKKKYTNVDPKYHVRCTWRKKGPGVLDSYNKRANGLRTQ